jgi:L-lactate dehydrogenase
MALGGSGHGHKGHALTVMTEVLTQAVAGYGRARNPPPSEENSVFLQVIDPTAFTPRSDYLQEINYLVDRVTRSTPDSPGTPVRMPGARAWRARKERLESGVDLYPGILEALEAEAVQLGVAVPDWDRLIP